MDVTTIKLSKETKSRLEKLKIHKRETYDDILQKMLEILNLSRASPERAQAKLRSIDKQNKALSQKKKQSSPDHGS